MSLNNIGVLMYGSVVMYILLYWILWFFKVPYYKKMLIHDSEPAQIFCMAYFIIMSCSMGIEMGIMYYDVKQSPPFTFIGSCILSGIWILCCLPEFISNLRKKIPNRWEE